SARSRRSSRARRSSPTPSASSPRSSSRTAPPRWRPCAAARSRSWTAACPSKRRSPAWPWGSSRRAARCASSPTFWATRTISVTWTSRSRARRPESPPRPRWARSTAARCARSSTSAPSWRSSRAPTAWCTFPSSPRSGCKRSPTSSRKATSSRSRCSRWTGRGRSGSPARKRSRRRDSRRRNGRRMQLTRLPNGVRVLSERLPDLTSATVGIWVENGSRYERAEQAGISHFLEHLFFKGTARRTAAQIAQEIDAVGGVLNAFTGKEYTCYYAKVLREHLPLALDLLADIFTQSTFAAEEIERERSVIVQEISQVEDTPDDYVHELFNLAFWPGHPLSRPIAGTAETVSRLERDDFLSSYCDAGYAGVYVGTGAEWTREVVEVIRDELGRVTRDGLTPDELLRAKNQMKGSLLLGLETSDSRMSRIAKNEIYFGRDVPLEEVAAGIDAVTNDDVLRVSRRLFRPDALALTVLGDLKG